MTSSQATDDAAAGDGSALGGEIDRDSPVPFYFQLAELLESQIVDGRWKPGAQLPAEPELSGYYGLSRTTIRQALARLEQGGLISRRKGHGTFVEATRQPSWLVQSSGGFFQEEVERLGRHVTSAVRRAERRPLPPWAAQALGLPPHTSGVMLERLRWVDGLVSLFSINYLPDQFGATISSMTDANASLYLVLRERHGVEVAGGRRSIEAVPADDLLAELLEVPTYTPLALIQSVSWDATLTPFDCYHCWLRTDRMRIDVDVQVAARTQDPAGPTPDGQSKGL
jgi:GntR family transcriptional regulator